MDRYVTIISTKCDLLSGGCSVNKLERGNRRQLVLIYDIKDKLLC